MRNLAPSIWLIAVSAVGFVSWLVINQTSATDRPVYWLSVAAILVCFAAFLLGIRTVANNLDK